MLRERGLTATYFVATGYLAEQRPDPRVMDAAQLRELADAGMTIGSHTRSHAILTRLAPDAAADEIAASRTDLEGLLDREILHFAYPGGAFDARLARQVQRAGYASACSVLGPAENDRDSLYWLFRDVLSESMGTLADRYRCSRVARRLLSFRVRRRLQAQLATA